MANRIRTLRTKHNMTLEDVAKGVGVGKSTVRKWETGMIANMRRDKIAALAKTLHTTPAYLMGWEDASVQETDNIVNQKKESIEITDSEMLMVKKYRSLDDYGKEMVDFVLNKEHERVSEEYVEFAARGGKYKVKKDVAVEWAKQVVNDPCEQDDDLC